MAEPASAVRAEPVGVLTGKVLSRRAAVLADQVLSSVSNVLVIPLIAPGMTPSELGQFILGFSILTLTLLISRSYFGTRVSLAPSPDIALKQTSNIFAALLLLAPLLVLANFASGALVTGGHSLDVLMLLALAAPVVCLQDILRFGAAASGRPWGALASDALWVSFVAVPLALRWKLEPIEGLYVWAAGAAAALAVAGVGMQLRPRVSTGIAELRARDRVSASIMIGYIGWALASLWILAFVGRVIGPAATGVLGAASKAMGPLNVLFSFIPLGVTPVLVRRNRDRDLYFCALTAAVIAAITLLWGMLLLRLPDSAGVALLGDSWHQMWQVLPWTIAEYAFLAGASASGIGLKVRSMSGALIRQRAAAAGVVVIVGSAAAVLTHETWVVAAVLALSTFTAACIGWRPLWRDARGPSGSDYRPEIGLPPVREA